MDPKALAELAAEIQTAAAGLNRPGDRIKTFGRGLRSEGHETAAALVCAVGVAVNQGAADELLGLVSEWMARKAREAEG